MVTVLSERVRQILFIALVVLIFIFFSYLFGSTVDDIFGEERAERIFYLLQIFIGSAYIYSVITENKDERGWRENKKALSSIVLGGLFLATGLTGCINGELPLWFLPVGVAVLISYAYWRIFEL